MAVTRDSLVVDISVNGKQAAADVDKFQGKLRDTAGEVDKNAEAIKQWSAVFGELSKALKSSNAETMAYMKSAIDAQLKAQQATEQTAKVVQDTASKQSGLVQSSKSVLDELQKTVGQTAQAISDNQTMIAGAIVGGMILMKDNVVDLVRRFAGGMDTVAATLSKVSVGFNAIGNVVKKTLPGSFFVITDLIGLLTPSLIMLGNKLEESDSAIARTSGTILKFSGILLGGFAAAVAYAINKIGDLAIAFGTTMLEEMRKSSDEFEKYQFSMRQFSSTINGFAMQFGDKAVGSFEKWKDVLEQVNMTTTFSRDAISGSIKLIMRETSHLGLGFQDAIKLLRVSSDLAAVSGSDLTDTTQRVISAISGESSSLTQLGFDLRNSVLSKSQFVKSTGLAVEQLDEEQATMARLKVLYEQTAPLIGAAAAQTDTITGAQILYKKTVDDVNITLGQHAVLTRFFTAQTIKAYTWFAAMPKPILHVIGVLKDFFSIFLIGVGTLIKFSLGITALVVAFKVLRGAALAYLGVQISLQAVVGSFLAVLAPLVAAIMLMDFAIRKMTSSSGGLSYIFKNISSAFDNTAQASGTVSEQFGVQEKEASLLTTTMQNLMDVMAALSSTIVNGLGMAILTVSSLFVQFRQAFATSEDDWMTYQLMLEDIESQIMSMSDEIKESWETVFPSKGLSAKAAVSSVDQVNEAVKKFRETATKAAREINKDFSEVAEVQKAIANEFERASMKMAETKKNLDKVFDVKLSPKETAEKVAAAEKEAAMARVEAEKLRFDTLKKLDEDARSARIKQLRDQGNIIQAIKEETRQRLDQVYATERGLKRIGGLRLEEQMLINQSIRSIKASEKTELNAANVESLKKIRDLEEAVNKIKIEAAKNDQDQVRSIMARTSQRAEELQQIHKIAAAQKDQKVAADELLKIGMEALNNTKSVEVGRFDKQRTIDLVNQTRDLKRTYEEIDRFAIQSIEAERVARREVVSLTKEKMELDGRLLESQQQQFEIQNKIADLIATKQVNAIRRSYLLFGEFLFSFKEYFSITKELVGISFNNIFKSFDNIVATSMAMVDRFINKKKELDQSGSSDGKAPQQPSNQPGPVAQWVTKAADSLSTWAGEATDAMGSVISDFIPEGVSSIASDIGSAVGEMGNIYMMIAKIIMEMPKIILGILDGVTSALQALLDFPRALVNALGRLDSMLTRFTDNIPKAIQGLAKALPNILRSIAAKLPDLIIALADALPELMEALAEVIPDLLARLLARLPDLVSSLTKSLGFAVWRMIVGLFRGIGDVWKGIKPPAIKLGIDKDYFAKSLASVTQDTNKLFTVNALTNAYKNAESMVNDIMDSARGIGKNIWKYFVQALKDGWKWLSEAGGKIWEGLKTAAATIGDWGTAIWNAFAAGAELIGEWGTKIWNGLTGAIGDVAETIGKWGKAIWDGLVTAVGDIAKTFGDWGTKIWNGFTGAIGEAFTGFGKSISDGFTGALPSIGTAIDSLFTGLGNTFKSLFKLDLNSIKTSIENAFSTGSDIMKGAFKAVFNPMIDVINGIIEAFNALKIPAITYGGSILGREFGGTLIGETDLIPGELTKVARLATGGLVTGPGGIDRVPAMLTAGEFVINKDAASSIGLPGLLALNSGRSQANPTIQNISLNLTIENKDRIDENFVRQRIMPALKEELKRGSLDGRAVVYSGGVRK